MSSHREDEPETAVPAETSPSGGSNATTPANNRYGSRGSGGSILPGGGDAANRIRAFIEGGDPESVSTLVWAHQLRRDLAHLVRSNEQTQVNLASALSATSHMQQAVLQLEHLVRELHGENRRLWETVQILNQEVVDKQEELDACVQTHFGLMDSWSLRINSLEHRADGVERFCARIIAKDESEGSIAAAIRERVVEIQRLRTLKQQNGGELSDNYSEHSVASFFGNVEEHEYAPGPHSASGRATLSNNERGIEDNESSDTVQSPRRIKLYFHPQLGKAIPLKQEGRTLAEYLLLGEDIRSHVSAEQMNGVILIDFVAGIEDIEAKAFVTKTLDESGWTWDQLKMAVWPISQDPGNSKVESVGASADAEATKPERKRRSIPIVPPDEEDMDFGKY